MGIILIMIMLFSLATMLVILMGTKNDLSLQDWIDVDTVHLFIFGDHVISRIMDTVSGQGYFVIIERGVFNAIYTKVGEQITNPEFWKQALFQSGGIRIVKAFAKGTKVYKKLDKLVKKIPMVSGL